MGDGMTTKTTSPLTRFPSRRAFEAWLRLMPPGKVVARGWGPCDCPLAKWVGTTGLAEGRLVFVNPHMGSWNVEPAADAGFAPGKPLPKWAVHFADYIDESNDGSPTTRVTASDCLEALKHA